MQIWSTRCVRWLVLKCFLSYSSQLTFYSLHRNSHFMDIFYSNGCWRMIPKLFLFSSLSFSCLNSAPSCNFRVQSKFPRLAVELPWCYNILVNHIAMPGAPFTWVQHFKQRIGNNSMIALTAIGMTKHKIKWQSELVSFCFHSTRTQL